MSRVAQTTKSKKGFLYRILCGALLGISIIAPGISGSVMAVVMGIYDELIDIISNPFKNFRRNVGYILPLCIGAGLSMAALFQVLRLLFEHYEIPAFMLFISLIAGSIPAIFAEAKSETLKPKYAAGVILAFSAALAVGLLAKLDVTVSVNTSAHWIPASFYYPITGAVAGITSMIPGMSVSMVLMMLNTYKPLLNAAADFDLLTIAPVCVCFVLGMVLFSKVTRFIFRKWRGLGYLMVLGFMCGSLVSVFPGLPETMPDALLSIAAIATGIAISILLRKLSRRFNKKEINTAG